LPGSHQQSFQAQKLSTFQHGESSDRPPIVFDRIKTKVKLPNVAALNIIKQLNIAAILDKITSSHLASSVNNSTLNGLPKYEQMIAFVFSLIASSRRTGL
jgi:hypothetical protein